MTERTIEPLAHAIESLNKAWEILAGQGLSGLSGAATRAGCTEFCGSYDGCGGYCKPMGAQIGFDPGTVEKTVEQTIEGIRLPFSR